MLEDKHAAGMTACANPLHMALLQRRDHGEHVANDLVSWATFFLFPFS